MMRAPDLNMLVGECSEPPGMDDGREGNIVRRGNYDNNYGNTAATPMDDVDVVRNTVARFLVCQGNTPVPHQEGNTESGGGGQNDQCPTP